MLDLLYSFAHQIPIKKILLESLTSTKKTNLQSIRARYKIQIQAWVHCLLSFLHITFHDCPRIISVWFWHMCTVGTGEYWPGKHSAVTLHPQAHCWLVCCRFFFFLQEQVLYLSWLLFLKGEFVFLKHTLHSPMALESDGLQSAVRHGNQNFKKINFCHGFGMLCFSDENGVCRVGL